MQTCLAALGFPAKKSDVLTMLDDRDHDPAEGIDYKGFEQILTSLYIGRTFDDLVNRAFDVFASEGKGHITLKGLKRITKDVGQSIDDEELKDMIRMFDRNEDGVIDKVRDTRILTGRPCLLREDRYIQWNWYAQEEFRRILRSLNPDDEESDDEN